MRGGALRRIIVASACAATFLGATSVAASAARYASPSGSGSTCSQTSPCAIGVAVNNASTGDEVIVNPGDYSVGTVLNPPLNAYVHGIQGQAPPRIHFAPGSYLWLSAQGTRASYLSVDGSTTVPMQVIATSASADQVVAASTGASTAACYVFGTLTDSVCWASGMSSDALKDTTGTSPTITLRNDTLEATAANGGGLDIDATTGGNITLNAVNVITRGIVLITSSGASITGTVDHSNYATIGGIGAGTTSVQETNRQIAAPSFVNGPGGDFREVPGSPTIDAGVTSAANGPFDAQGFPRTINGTTDVGAYEFDPFAGVVIGTTKSKVKKRKAKVSIGCPAATPGQCAGSLTLAYGYKTAGSSSFSIAAGAAQTLKVKISKRAFKKLSGKGKLATQATATSTDGAGTSATATGKIKLKA